MTLTGKKIGIIGLQRTGIATAVTLLKLGAQVIGVDRKPADHLPGELQDLRQAGAQLFVGNHDCPDLDSCDLIIPSPGVPLTIEPLKRARQLGIPVLSEIELAYRLCPAPIAAITGTNGKTTTTILLGQMLQDDGRATLVAGNIGIPLIKEVTQLTNQHVVVLEVSSFQLEAIDQFRPEYAVLLNLAPDHLDRYASVEDYVRAKSRLFVNQRETDFAVLNQDDPLVWDIGRHLPSQIISICSGVQGREESMADSSGRGLTLLGNGLLVSTLHETQERICSLQDIPLTLRHNLLNMMSASAVALLMGTSPETVAGTLSRFRGVEHRLEFIATVSGVQYINDSKATNVHASLHALRASQSPVILIAGGRVKESDFSEWAALVKQKVKRLLLIGEGAELLRNAAASAGVAGIEDCPSLEEAVLRSHESSQTGDTVLLSPACASYDMFRDYEQRGAVFKQSVMALVEKKPDR